MYPYRIYVALHWMNISPQWSIDRLLGPFCRQLYLANTSLSFIGTVGCSCPLRSLLACIPPFLVCDFFSTPFWSWAGDVSISTSSFKSHVLSFIVTWIYHRNRPFIDALRQVCCRISDKILFILVFYLTFQTNCKNNLNIFGLNESSKKFI